MSDLRKDSRVGATLVGARTVQFDATLAERVTREAAITEYEVDQGADISDHVRLRQLRIELTGIATTTPIGAAPDPQRDVRLRADLMALFEARQTVTLTCEQGTFADLVITGLEEDSDPETSQAIIVAVSLTQIRRASRFEVALPPAPATRRRTSREVDRGPQGVVEDYEAGVSRVTDVPMSPAPPLESNPLWGDYSPVAATNAQAASTATAAKAAAPSQELSWAVVLRAMGMGP